METSNSRPLWHLPSWRVHVTHPSSNTSSHRAISTAGWHRSVPPSATDSPFKLPMYVFPLAASSQCRTHSMPTINRTSPHSDNITPLTNGTRGMETSASRVIMARCEYEGLRDRRILLPADRACTINVQLVQGYTNEALLHMSVRLTFRNGHKLLRPTPVKDPA